MIIVFADMIGIIIMALFFNKLAELNSEYIEIMDNMRVQMSDFSIKIDDL